MNDCRKSVCLSAPAKLNLGLRIVGRRPDGYHLLESVFWPITLCDSLQLEAAATSRVQCTWYAEAPRLAALPTEQNNTLWRVLGHPVVAKLGAWDILLKKRIPIEAGLGGGSADAGALLRFLSEQFASAKSDLRTVALEIGADVPFFLDPVPSWIEGVGERQIVLPREVTQLDLHFLIVFPAFGCNTREVFARFRERNAPFSEGRPSAHTFTETSFLEYLKVEARNDLEAAAVETQNSLSSILQHLRESEALTAGLTGSGSTCYAAFLSRDAAEQCAQGLLQFLRKSDCKSIVASTYRT